jgi:hypothetical protein
VFWLPYRTFAMEHAPSPGPSESPWLVDEFVESYARWREESSAVRSAYDYWASVEPCDRELAWGAYRAALDREERAAHAYRESGERIADRRG